MVDWCLDELRYKASLIPEGHAPPPIVVFNGDVVKSDTALPLEFKSALQTAVNAFEAQIPENLKDWHPGSDRKVWDLVHPSLFPLVYGRTRVLGNGETTDLTDCVERCGQGEILHHAIAAIEGPKPTFGSEDVKFQWLPCEVDISQDTAKCATTF